MVGLIEDEANRTTTYSEAMKTVMVGEFGYQLQVRLLRIVA